MLNILQSFLAFAATMLVLATLVTLIIEIVARIFRRRYRIFTHLLRQLFKKELQPLIESSIKTQLGEDPDKVAAEIENPDIAQNVADNAAAYADAYTAAQQRLDDALAALDRPETGQVESIAEARKEIEAIRDRLESAPANVFALTAEGIPIGLNYFPFCRFRDTITMDGEVAYPCKDIEARYRLFSPQASATDLWPDYLLWIIKVIITGVLIGLGGPFWYDAVRGLARATQILRGRASPPKAPAGSLPGARTPSNPVDIFKRHVELDGTMPDREDAYGGPRWRSPTET